MKHLPAATASMLPSACSAVAGMRMQGKPASPCVYRRVRWALVVATAARTAVVVSDGGIVS